MRVLIAGCGYVGTALGLELCDAGHEVWGLRRDPEGLPEPIRPLAADLTDRASLGALPRKLDAVAITASADGRDVDAYRAAYVDGPTTLLGFLADRGDPVERVVFTSSTAVYGQRDGEWVDETSETDPGSATARVLVEAEQAVLASAFPATVVRLGGIYGPGRTRLLEQVRRGAATCPPPPTYTNRIHRDDCADVLRHLLELAAPETVYNAVDHAPADRCEVLRWLADRLGVDDPPVDGDAQARGSKRVSNRRLVESGYAFRYPTFREGYAPLTAS